MPKIGPQNPKFLNSSKNLNLSTVKQTQTQTQTKKRSKTFLTNDQASQSLAIHLSWNRQCMQNIMDIQKLIEEKCHQPTHDLVPHLHAINNYARELGYVVSLIVEINPKFFLTYRPTSVLFSLLKPIFIKSRDFVIQKSKVYSIQDITEKDIEQIECAKNLLEKVNRFKKSIRDKEKKDEEKKDIVLTQRNFFILSRTMLFLILDIDKFHRLEIILKKELKRTTITSSKEIYKQELNMALMGLEESLQILLKSVTVFSEEASHLVLENNRESSQQDMSDYFYFWKKHTETCSKKFKFTENKINKSRDKILNSKTLSKIIKCLSEIDKHINEITKKWEEMQKASRAYQRKTLEQTLSN
jgi:hypothetical protein